MTSIALEELRRACDLEEDQKVRERIRLISGIMEGHSAIEVAKIMMVSESKVNYWRRRFREEGLEGLRDRPRSGRLPKVPRWRMERIRRIVEAKQYWMATEVTFTDLSSTINYYPFANIFPSFNFTKSGYTNHN